MIPNSFVSRPKFVGGALVIPRSQKRLSLDEIPVSVDSEDSIVAQPDVSGPLHILCHTFSHDLDVIGVV